ncbi:hypothetical protein [Amycolatopsis sp. NPDC004378]
MGIFRKAIEKIDRAAEKKIDTTVEQADVKPADRKPAPKKPGDAKFARGLGERIGFAGIAVFTVAAALSGAVACKPDNPGRPAPTTAATCEEDQPWCWDCHRDGNKRCGPDDGAVKR